MPAGITETDAMAYVGQKPWHNLGVKVEGDVMTAQQAIEATGMDWQVGLQPLYLQDGREVLTHRATFRTDNNDVLGVVGNRYFPVQNVDCFNLFDAVIGTGEAKYDTVGTLQGGKRIWMLAKFDKGIVLDNGEKIESYMLLTNSHDGGSALSMRWCDIRVVCQNTFEMAKRDKGDLDKGLQRFYGRHTSGILMKTNEARTLLGLQHQYQERLAEEINDLAETEWNRQDMKRLTYTLLGMNGEKGVEDHNGSVRENAKTILRLFEDGVGNSGETAWDAYNAVTDFTSHYKGHGRSVESIGSTDEK